MRLWVSDQVRNPNQHREEPQHERHETCCKLCLSIDENGQRCQGKSDGREYGPKHLVRRNPLWNQVSGITKKQCLPKVKETAQTPSPRRATRPNGTAFVASVSIAVYSATAPQSKEMNR